MARWFLARRHLTRRAGSTVGLVLVVALASGAVLGLVAGARRTDAAFPHFVEQTRPASDVYAYAQLDDEIPFEADDQSALEALLDRVPEVERAARGTYVITSGADASGRDLRLLSLLTIDPGRDLTFGRPHVVAGSWPDDDVADAIAVDEELATRAGLEVGDTYRLMPYTIAQFGPAGEGADIEPAGPSLDLRVAAVYRYPVDLQPMHLDQRGINVDGSEAQLTPAFWDEYGPDLARYGVGVAVELVDGATVDDLEAALEARIPGRFVLERGLGNEEALQGIERAVQLQARGLWVVAGVTGVTGLALLWLLFSRRAAADRDRDATLRALGLGPREVARVSTVEGIVIGVVGGAIGTIGAWLSSAWMPFGLAGRAELEPGLRLDVPVVAAGPFVTVVVLATVSWLTARLARRPAGPRRSSRLTATAARAGLAPSALVGLGFALQPERAERRIPVRAAFVGVAVAGAVIAAAAGIGASFDLVRDEPARRGAYWDVAAGNFASVEAADAAAAKVATNPDVEAFGGETFNEVSIDGRFEQVATYFEGEGQLEPIVVGGRPPVAADEIALGGRVLERLGVDIGDTVEASMSGEPVAMRVVGQALVEDVEGSLGGPGKAGLMSEAALTALDPLNPDDHGPTWFVVRFADGVEHEAAIERLERDFPRTVTTSRLPTDLQVLQPLGGLVALLALIVGVLGTGAALFALVGAVSRRRRELAVLRTLGFVRRQAGMTIAWQATTFAVIGLAIGVPVGVAAGRGGWTMVADGIGIVPTPVVPVATVAGIVAGGVLVLNLVAAVPAWMARRLRPAEILRAE